MIFSYYCLNLKNDDTNNILTGTFTDCCDEFSAIVPDDEPTSGRMTPLLDCSTVSELLLPLAIIISLAIMIGCAFAIERWLLRPLVNQAQIILFMATIGLNFVFEGGGQIVWGSDVKKLDIGIPDNSYDIGGVLLNSFDLTAAAVAAVLVAFLAVFFQKTAVGRAHT